VYKCWSAAIWCLTVVDDHIAQAVLLSALTSKARDRLSQQFEKPPGRASEGRQKAPFAIREVTFLLLG